VKTETKEKLHIVESPIIGKYYVFCNDKYFRYKDIVINRLLEAKYNNFNETVYYSITWHSEKYKYCCGIEEFVCKEYKRMHKNINTIIKSIMLLKVGDYCVFGEGNPKFKYEDYEGIHFGKLIEISSSHGKWKYLCDLSRYMNCCKYEKYIIDAYKEIKRKKQCRK
jgi:L-rhamnose mutarotase